VVAVPFLLHARSSSRASVAAVSAGSDLAAPLRPADTAASTSDASTTDASTTEAPTSATGDIIIAVPDTQPAGVSVQTGRAQYRAWAPGEAFFERPCAFPYARGGTVLTVTNLDNGHSTTCTVALKKTLPGGQLIVLDTPIFQELGDLIEAPIPVRVTWATPTS
jgi:hypothetical protein